MSLRLLRASRQSDRREQGRQLALLGDGLDYLEKISPGVRKKGHAKAHCGYIVWFAGYRHVASLNSLMTSSTLSTMKPGWCQPYTL
jgi:hypothetical protein